MSTLDSLKQVLRREAKAMSSSLTQDLFEMQYSTGFDIILQGPVRMAYQEFITLQLSVLLCPLFSSRSSISILEVGPGPDSIPVYVYSSQRN